MNKSSYKKILQFIIVFTLGVLIPLYTFLYFRGSEATSRIKRFDDKNISFTCLESPDKTSFSKCLQKDLSYILEDINFIQLQRLFSQINSVEEYDKTNAKDKLQSSVDHFYSYEIVIDHIKNFTLRRSSIEFAEIIFLPITKFILLKMISNKKDRLNHLLQSESLPIEKRQKLLRIESKMRRLVEGTK